MKKWKIRIIPEKSQAFQFSRISTLQNKRLKVENIVPDWKENAKYLEVGFHSKLIWNSHKHQMVDQKDSSLSVFQQKQQTKPHDQACDVLNRCNACHRMRFGGKGSNSKNKYGDVETCPTKNIRQIGNAPWYIRNRKIRQDLNVDTIKSQVRRWNNILLEKIEDIPYTILKTALFYDPTWAYINNIWTRQILVHTRTTTKEATGTLQTKKIESSREVFSHMQPFIINTFLKQTTRITTVLDWQFFHRSNSESFDISVSL